MKDVLLKLLMYPRPLRYALGRRLIRWLCSYEKQLSAGVVDRPHYGYCIFQAANLAALLGYPRISVVEFGCGGGNGLLAAESHIAQIKKLIPIDIELYGFDIGSGLPAPKDYRDIPHFFRAGFYEMDRPLLEQRLKLAKLVIGDVKETCADFFERYHPAPLSCVFVDLDFYSSTADALKLFDGINQYLLPRVFIYFDDIIGDALWLCNEFTGEALAVDEFNASHTTKKIARNHYLSFEFPHDRWPSQIYIYHDFQHPKYNEYIGAESQTTLDRWIKLNRQGGPSGRRPVDPV
jgi:hypothetical protein